MKVRASGRFAASVVVTLALLAAPAVARADSGSAGFQPVTLCHASPTGEGNSGPAKQYETITVDNQGELNGHLGHPNDIIPAPEGGCPVVTPPSPTPPPPPPTNPPPVPKPTPPPAPELVRYRIFTTMPRFHETVIGEAGLPVSVRRTCGSFRVSIGTNHYRIASYDRTFLRVKSEGKLLAAAIGQKHGC